MIYMHGAQLPVPFLPIRPGKQTEIAKYLCRKYSPHFTNLKMAKVFVHHTLKLYDARPDNDNKDPFRDKRGENRKRTKRDNPIVIENTDRILTREKGRPNQVVRDRHRYHGGIVGG